MRCFLLQLVGSYPVVAKSLRDIRKSGGKVVHRQHCCGMTLQEHGLGYEDLDKLLKNPQPLEFIIGNNTSDISPRYSFFFESNGMQYLSVTTLLVCLFKEFCRLLQCSFFVQLLLFQQQAEGIMFLGWPSIYLFIHCLAVPVWQCTDVCVIRLSAHH